MWSANAQNGNSIACCIVQVCLLQPLLLSFVSCTVHKQVGQVSHAGHKGTAANWVDQQQHQRVWSVPGVRLLSECGLGLVHLDHLMVEDHHALFSSWVPFGVLYFAVCNSW